MVANKHEDIRRSPFIPQPSDPGKDIFYLLSTIEELIQQGKPVPGTDMKMINRPEILFLIDQIRTMIQKKLRPSSVPELDQLSLEEVERQGAAIIAEGQRKAAAMLAETELEQLAEHLSGLMIAQAQEEGSRIIAGAEEYAAQTLMTLEEHLSSLQRRLLV